MSKASEIASSMMFIDDELNKEAMELEANFDRDMTIERPFKMSDYIKPQIVNEEDLANELKKEASEKKPALEKRTFPKRNVKTESNKKDLKKDKIDKIASNLLEEAGLLK